MSDGRSGDEHSAWAETFLHAQLEKQRQESNHRPRIEHNPYANIILVPLGALAVEKQAQKRPREPPSGLPVLHSSSSMACRSLPAPWLSTFQKCFTKFAPPTSDQSEVCSARVVAARMGQHLLVRIEKYPPDPGSSARSRTLSKSSSARDHRDN
jgi:hypothetical protein